MTDTKTQPEPTMEEILASIRRIISENDEDQEAKKQPMPPPPAAAAAAVLELTEMVSDDGTVVSLAAAREQAAAAPKAEEPAPAPSQDETIDAIIESVGQPANAEMTMDNPQDDAVDFVSPNEQSKSTGAKVMEDGLVSAATAAAATATFAQLARTLAQEPQSSGNMPIGQGRTLEDLVKEMLRPMLKEWLDANLPAMVEHMVRLELDRMTRRAGDV